MARAPRGCTRWSRGWPPARCFAVIGAGLGAAPGNTPAALTRLYLVFLGVMPVLDNVEPETAAKIDPSYAAINLAQGAEQTTSIAVLAGWVVISLVAGAVMTRRPRRPIARRHWRRALSMDSRGPSARTDRREGRP
jgi:hypothetical protein